VWQKKKTILIVDDEQGLVEALEDALTYEGHIVLKASTAEQALQILKTQHVDLVTIDIMMPPGPSFEADIDSHKTGVFLCQTIKKQYPKLELFVLSVVSDIDTIRTIQKLGVTFLRKGEIPLRTVLDRIKAKLSGLAYSSDWEDDRRKH
jgi:two-component system response regulator FlrC